MIEVRRVLLCWWMWRIVGRRQEEMAVVARQISLFYFFPQKAVLYFLRPAPLSQGSPRGFSEDREQRVFCPLDRPHSQTPTFIFLLLLHPPLYTHSQHHEDPPPPDKVHSSPVSRPLVGAPITTLIPTTTKPAGPFSFSYFSTILTVTAATGNPDALHDAVGERVTGSLQRLWRAQKLFEVPDRDRKMDLPAIQFD